MLVACVLEDVDAGGVSGCNVGIDLMKRCVLQAELGESLYHGGAIALAAIFVRDDQSDGGATVDRVVVVELYTTDGDVG